ncbi:putative essential protein Yae1 [Rosa chinensis]|uniref:Putative essential protein Yae1 n=1 Tax=Rosa chinensis TaxID=74649 RepID=A0A2P6PCB8_ROSCH|nr:putative essential protein Yae1 [Rosa chinensis]
MEGGFADELYSESLQLSKLQLGSTSNVTSKQSGLDDHVKVQLSDEDGSSWCGSDNEVNEASDVDKEWQRRRDQFHTMGYRDGVIAGKEASSQEGFSIGFKQSVLVGYNWGLFFFCSSYLICSFSLHLFWSIFNQNEVHWLPFQMV